MVNFHGLSILLALVLSSASAFQSVKYPSNRLFRETSRLFESTDDEIAQLEAKLRKLKQEKEKQEQSVSTITDPVEKLEEVPLDMFLTEQWKEKDASNSDGQSSGGGITTILYAVGAAVVIALFSQIPIGQEDLSKYSIGNSPASEQIDLGDLNRARRSGDL